MGKLSREARARQRKRRRERDRQQKRIALAEERIAAGEGDYADASCRRKISYDSEDDALHAALKAFAKRGVELRAYRCEICGGWHLTHRFDRETWGGDRNAED